MSNSNKLKRLIEKRILMPAYVGMITGLIVRSVALVLSTAVSYDTWPIIIRIAVEAMAALGMVGCADVVLSVSSASAAALDRQIAITRTSPQYTPNPRLKKEKYQQEKELMDHRRALAISGLEQEKTKEQRAIGFCATVTVVYGVLFAVTTMKNTNIVTILTEIVGIAAIPFITWYLSAQYKEDEDAKPEETAKATALAVVDDKLQGVRERFRNGTETPQDVSLMDAATESFDYQNRLVKRLAARQAGVKYYTTPQIYAYFGAEDASTQATIRRIIREAGKRGDYGVIWDDEKGAWLTPSVALDEMFPPDRLPRRAVVTRRTRPSRFRKQEATTAEKSGANTEQASDTARSPGDVSAPPDAPPLSLPGNDVELAPAS